MATLNEFSSLLQLGVGIGIGLSLFRAPIDLRVTSLTAILENETRILQTVQTTAAKARLADFASAAVELAGEHGNLESDLRWFLGATLLGAVANWAALIWASLDATHTLNFGETILLLTISVFYYAAILGALEILARRRLRVLTSKIQELSRA